MPQPETQKKKFSLNLWALLAVVALIAVMVSLLLPTFGRAKQMSREVLALCNARLGAMEHVAAPLCSVKAGESFLGGLGPSAAYGAAPATPAVNLRLIYDAWMAVAVEDELAETFPATLEEKVRGFGGYVSGSSSSRQSGQKPSGQITVRVPSAKLKEMMDWIGSTTTVMNSRLSVHDITEQYVDLEARLGNLLAGEARLKELLSKATGKLEDVLNVERELRRIRQEIEQLQGRKRLWDNQIAYSTLTVDYHLPGVYRAEEPAAQTFGQRSRYAMRDSWRSFTEAMSDLAIGGIYVLPWLPVPLIALVAVLIPIRRARRRKKAG